MKEVAAYFLGMNRFLPIIFFAVMMLASAFNTLGGLPPQASILALNAVASFVVCILMVGFPWALIVSFSNLSQVMRSAITLFAMIVGLALSIQLSLLPVAMSGLLSPAASTILMSLAIYGFMIGLPGFIGLIFFAAQAYSRGARNSGLKANSLVTFFALFYFILGVIWLQPRAQKMRTTA